MLATRRKPPRPHPLIPEVNCACGSPIAWLHRPDHKRVPADPRTGCFIVYLADNAFTGRLEPRGVTLRELKEKAVGIQLRDGGFIPIDTWLAIVPNHYASCKHTRRRISAGPDQPLEGFPSDPTAA